MLTLTIPSFIADNVGRIVTTAAAATLGAVGYANREVIGRWIAGEDDDSPTRSYELEVHKRKRQQAEAEAATAAQEVRKLQGQVMLSELDRKHDELLEKLTQSNAAVLGEVRTMMTSVRGEVAALRVDLDAQRGETAQLGQELRSELATLKERQDRMEQAHQGQARKPAVPNGEQRPQPRTRGNGASNGAEPTSRRGRNGSTRQPRAA